MQDKCEVAGDDEEQVVTVTVTEDMKPQDVMQKTLEMIQLLTIEKHESSNTDLSIYGAELSIELSIPSQPSYGVP